MARGLEKTAVLQGKGGGARVLTSYVRDLPGEASGEADFPEVLHRFGELNSDCPLAVLQGPHKHDPAFPLLARAFVYKQNALVLFDPSSQRKRPAVSGRSTQAR